MTVASFGQAARPPAFEVTSVRVVPADSRIRSSMRGGPGSPDGGQITYTHVTLFNVLLRAYNVKNYQVVGPDWLSSQRYDISATMPPGTAREQFGPMLQNLLAERFHMVLHHESRDIQGFDLLTARSGPKLKPSIASGAPPAVIPPAGPKIDTSGFPILEGPGLAMMEGMKGKAVVSFLTAKEQPLSALVDMLSREFRLPIADKTGLAGKFDFTLEFAPQQPGAVELLSTITDDSAPNLTSAVQQQLGLRLSPSKIPLDVLVVDRAERVPTEN